MHQFTLDTITLPYSIGQLTKQLKVYSVTSATKSRCGLAISTDGKVSLLRPNEANSWTQAGTRGNGAIAYTPDTTEHLEEWQFNEAIALMQSAGVQKIASSAMRIVFAENNDLRARYMGARRARSNFAMPWVRFTNKSISSEHLKLLGATAKCLASLLANGYLKEAKAPAENND